MLMRETRTSDGRTPSRSVKSCDHEKLLLLTSACAACKVLYCSSVMLCLISAACFWLAALCARSACTCRSDASASAFTARYCATMRTSAKSETAEMTTATVHGSARLRNGSLARLSLEIKSFSLSEETGGGG